MLKTHRGRGAGKLLMQALDEKIALLDGKIITMHSQMHAVPFYERSEAPFSAKHGLKPLAVLDMLQKGKSLMKKAHPTLQWRNQCSRHGLAELSSEAGLLSLSVGYLSERLRFLSELR